MLATMTMSTEANAGTDDRDFAIPLMLGPVGSQENVTFSVTPGNTVAGSVSFFALPCLMGNAGGFRSSQIEISSMYDQRLLHLRLCPTHLLLNQLCSCTLVSLSDGPALSEVELGPRGRAFEPRLID